jgi:hypothetical protein
MNQSAGPANIGSASSLQAGDILYFMRVLLFITLLCMGYSLSRPMPAKGKEQDMLLPATAGAGSEDKEWAGLPQWQKKASEKAVISYAAAQEKKWQRWNEAMFERSS